jgi:hydrogenase expression/formation protein HypE
MTGHSPIANRKSQIENRILLAHGGGGELTRQLLAERIVPKLSNALLAPLTDSALLDLPSGRICLTTDAYVVQPVEFPGGDIGRLAVCGTVNDLAVCGARPHALSLALVLEEGLELALLDRVIDSIAAAAKEAGVVVATGDTKVVERQRGDGLTITTAGVGPLREGVQLGMERVRAGDVILVTGRIAEHGLAVMSAREGLKFSTAIRSDVAPLVSLIESMLAAGGAGVKFLRDPTRGGLACVLADLAEGAKLAVEVEESAVPISAAVLHTAEMLGLDPLTIANEGKCVAVVASDAADAVLAACRSHPLGACAAIIGRLVESPVPLVELITRIGGRRIVQRPYGEELPRIC